MSIRDRIRNMTPREKAYLGAAAILLLLVAIRWEKISRAIIDSFSKLFEAR